MLNIKYLTGLCYFWFLWNFPLTVLARDCRGAGETFIQYRDSLFGPGRYFEHRYEELRSMVRPLGIDVSDNEAIRTVACRMRDSPAFRPGQLETVEALCDSLYGDAGLYFSRQDNPHVRAAEIVLWVRKNIRQALWQVTFERNYSNWTDILYEQLDFPNFPLALSVAEIAGIVSSYPEGFLGQRFYYIVSYDGGKVSHNISALVAALANSQTLADFVAFFGREDNYYYDYFDDCQELSCYPELLNDEKDPAELDQYIRILDDIVDWLTRSELWNIQRSSSPLKCEEVLDNIMETIHLANDFFGERPSGILSGFELFNAFDHPETKREWLCQFVESKSQSELMDLLLQIPEDGYHYYDASRRVMSFLINPSPLIQEMESTMESVELLESSGFPHFPLQLGVKEAQQIAAVLEHNGMDTERMVEAFTTVQTFENAKKIISEETMNNLMWVIKTLGGKEKKQSFEHLFFLVHRILRKLEKGGLFMLPE